MRPVLGIETSCDETAAAVLDEDGRVLAEAVLSQEREHAPYGGVVPEIAARAHLAFLPEQVRGVMARAGLGFAELGGVAASAGPGLIGGLIVGSQFAKGIAIAHGLPFVAVNHLEAHALTARLPGLVEGGVAFPYLLLLVSGGHCLCVAVEGVGRHARLGGTVDDAAGEAFDKVAKLLGLGWPGGPALEKLAVGGDARRYAFPRPMLGRAGCDFSFSGPEDRGGARGGAAWGGSAAGAGGGRHRRELPARGGRGAGGPGDARDGDDARAFAGCACAGGRRRGGGERGNPCGAGGGRRANRDSNLSRLRCGCAPTMR